MDTVAMPNYSPDGRYRVEPQSMPSSTMFRAAGILRDNLLRGHDELAQRTKLLETTGNGKAQIFDTGDAR